MLDIQTSESRIDPEVIHDVLRNNRRRLTLQYLKQRLEPVSLRNLSERIAELEASETPAPRKLRQSVYNSLHQTHLPKLDEIGIVEYDKNRKMISLTERARDVDIYMDVGMGWGITWATYYRTLGVFGLVSIVLSEVSTPLLNAVEPLLIATLFLFVFAGSTAYQLWSRRWFYLRTLASSE